VTPRGHAPHRARAERWTDYARAGARSRRAARAERRAIGARRRQSGRRPGS
jgi:hypothetical protein